MKRSVFLYVLFETLVCLCCFGNIETMITFEATDLGSGRWEYTYEVANIALPSGIEEFTIWFDIDLYDNLTITSTGSVLSDWDELILPSDQVLGDPAAYDALIGHGNLINVGGSMFGFSVSYDWLGTGSPGAQFYEIIDPDTFSTIDSGMTIPEPATLLFWGLGGWALRRR